jgi:hypothetical protein
MKRSIGRPIRAERKRNCTDLYYPTRGLLGTPYYSLSAHNPRQRVYRAVQNAKGEISREKAVGHRGANCPHSTETT